MDKQIKHLLELYKQKRYSKIENIPSNKMMKIDSEEITRVIKKNHSYLICTCESSGKTEHNSLCRHKQFFIMFPVLEFFLQRLDKLIKDYEGYKNLSLPVSIDCFINDLRSLKYGK